MSKATHMIHFVAFVDDRGDSVKVCLSTISNVGVCTDYECEIIATDGTTHEEIVDLAVSEWLDVMAHKAEGYRAATPITSELAPPHRFESPKLKVAAIVCALIAFAIGALFGVAISGSAHEGTETGAIEHRPAPPLKRLSDEQRGLWLETPNYSSEDRCIEVFEWAQRNGDYRGVSKAVQFLHDHRGRRSLTAETMMKYLQSLDIEKALEQIESAPRFGVDPNIIKERLRGILDD